MIKIYENLNLQDLDGEVWKVIKDFSDYQVSNIGRVKRVVPDKYNRKLRILKQWKCKNYLAVELNGKTYKVHRLVLMAFKPVFNMNELQCNHIDGNKKNNLLENLEWCNNSENQKHAFKIGLENNIGENNPHHKLTEQEVIKIKLLLKEGILTQQEIANIFGISRKTISDIKIGKTWNHIEI